MIKRKVLQMCRAGSAVIIFGVILLWSFSSLAQNINISGTVTDTKGETLPGVSVLVKGTKNGGSTSITGQYTLKNVPPDAILVFNYMGFKQRELAVKGNKKIDISLEEEVKALDEVVVVGYGTVRKSHLTGSVAKLKNENLDEIPTARLDNALVGKIAGVSVQNVNPEAGGEPTIRVRGLSSISASSSPLVVVDGHPVPDGLAFINPYDVESIEVLKDAASSAIYGSRGANGVIIVTTKRGVADKPRFTVKSYYGLRDTYKLHPMMNFAEYAQLLYDEAALRENDPSATRKNLMTDHERAAYVIETQMADGATDWQREALNSNAGVYNVQLGISGGKKDLRYYVSANMQKDEGLMKYNENSKGNFKVKLDANLSSKVSISVNLNPTYNQLERPASNFTDYSRAYRFLPVKHNAFTAAFVNQNSQWAGIQPGDWAQPRHFNGLYYSGLMPDGTFWRGTAVSNPWSSSNNTPLSIASRVNRNSETYRMLGGADVVYKIIKGLEFKTTVSGYYSSRENKTLSQTDARSDGAVNEAVITTDRQLDVLWENTLNYNKQIKDHSFTGLLGFTAQKTTFDNSNMLGRDFPFESFETINQGKIDQAETYSTKTETSLISYLGRITYDYKGKYMLAASLRTDGSSLFYTGNKFGWFPSASAGWRVSGEPFMQPAKDWLSNLKLRFSYGVTGNNRIEPYSYMDLLNSANYSFGSGTGGLVLGLSPNGEVIANRDITWERTFEYNAGVDLGFLNDRLNLTAEYYNSETDQLLLKQATMAFSGSSEFWNNVGRVRNRGLELEFSSVNISSKSFQWNTAINFAANRNTLLGLGGEAYQHNVGERSEIYTARVGAPSIQFFGYKTDGVFVSQAQIDELQAAGQTSNVASYYALGGLKYVDINGDNRIDEADRTVIGSPFPDFTWGLNNTLKFKGIDLSILIQGSQGGELINGDANYTENKRLNKNFTENRWVSELNPGDGKTPYLTTGSNWMLTDYVVESASYAALRNVIVGYTFPVKMLKKTKINSLRFYASGDNLIFLTGKSYRGINPEARTTSNQYASPLVTGYQRGSFPITRSFTFGIDVNF